jgi:hypothetical protein
LYSCQRTSAAGIKLKIIVTFCPWTDIYKLEHARF